VREREELPCERGAAFRRETDLHDVITHLAVRGQGVLDELRVVHDDREDVVEIVGDPTREPTDALETFGLSEPLFERKPVMHRRTLRTQVADKCGEDVTARSLRRGDGKLDRDFATIPSAGLELDAPSEDRADAPAPVLFDAREVACLIAFGNDQGDHGLSHRVSLGPPECRLSLTTPFDDRAGLVHSDDGVER
jgi:hypothetical protein